MDRAAIDDDFISFGVVGHDRAYHSHRDFFFGTTANLPLHSVEKNEISRPDFVYAKQIIHQRTGGRIPDGHLDTHITGLLQVPSQVFEMSDRFLIDGDDCLSIGSMIGVPRVGQQSFEPDAAGLSHGAGQRNHFLRILKGYPRAVCATIDLDPAVNRMGEVSPGIRQALGRFEQQAQMDLSGEVIYGLDLAPVEGKSNGDVAPAVPGKITGHIDRRDGDCRDSPFAKPIADRRTLVGFEVWAKANGVAPGLFGHAGNIGPATSFIQYQSRLLNVRIEWHNGLSKTKVCVGFNGCNRLRHGCLLYTS